MQYAYFYRKNDSENSRIIVIIEKKLYIIERYYQIKDKVVIGFISWYYRN